MENPYEAPKSEIAIPEDSELVKIRKAHISVEESVKAMGGLYIITGIIIVIVAISVAFTMRDKTVSMIAVVAISIIVAVGCFITGRDMGRFILWTRIPTLVITTPVLLLFPVGTLIGAYVLYLIIGKKGRFVFTKAYQEIIAATPDVKYSARGK